MQGQTPVHGANAFGANSEYTNIGTPGYTGAMTPVGAGIYQGTPVYGQMTPPYNAQAQSPMY